ncbi:hypothetical protein [Thalassotalea sp. G2M2-11]|uniref:hypothetical protein n=1 Tax=Thalassotalea sp. G2M2-11 TaxID=2787627 RepID=UPI0019D15A49|nr:hypothetical protein [Thalassotalea sp. G2M2-11]
MDKITQITEISAAGIQVANYFRLGYEGQANKELIIFLDRLELLLSAQTGEVKNSILTLTEVMFQAQTRNDMLFLADILQYELLPLLHNL